MPFHCTQVTGEIHGTDDRLVEFMLLQGAHTGFQCAQARGFLGRDGKRRATDTECPCDTTGNDATQCPHRAVGAQGRTAGLAQMSYPRIQFGMT